MNINTFFKYSITIINAIIVVVVFHCNMSKCEINKCHILFNFEFQLQLQGSWDIIRRRITHVYFLFFLLHTQDFHVRLFYDFCRLTSSAASLGQKPYMTCSILGPNLTKTT